MTYISHPSMCTLHFLHTVYAKNYSSHHSKQKSYLFGWERKKWKILNESKFQESFSKNLENWKKLKRGKNSNWYFRARAQKSRNQQALINRSYNASLICFFTVLCYFSVLRCFPNLLVSEKACFLFNLLSYLIFKFATYGFINFSLWILNLIIFNL